MANPFKKIVKNSKEHKSTLYASEEGKEAKVYTKQCNSCGAPRPTKSNLTKCSYCKTPFMQIDTIINSDT